MHAVRFSSSGDMTDFVEKEILFHAAVHEHLAVAVRHDPKVLVHVPHERARGRRSTFVPRQQSPHRADGVVAVEQEVRKQDGPRSRYPSALLNARLHELQRHLPGARVDVHLLREGYNPPAERRQEFEPPQDGNHRQREEDRVEVALHRAAGAAGDVDLLRDSSHRGRAPGLHLQLVQAEEHFAGFLIPEHVVPERVLDRHEERGRAEQLLRREHALPLAVQQVHVLDRAPGAVGGDERVRRPRLHERVHSL
mmetsp:Transcript_6153/g.22508  ORF Transcript_6153/g.22508 Transcript_6153/m.22508 type:complete len:252 (+) Transcript_6153:3842-4597(+)